MADKKKPPPKPDTTASAPTRPIMKMEWALKRAKPKKGTPSKGKSKK